MIRTRLIFAVICIIPALLVGWVLDKPDLMVSAALASFISGWMFWWWLMTGRETHWPRAATVGMLTTIVAHWGTFVLILLYGAFSDWVKVGCQSTLCGFESFFKGLLATFFFGGLSLSFLGIFTITSGAILGGALALYEKRRAKRL